MHHDKYFIGLPTIPCGTPAVTEVYNYPVTYPEYSQFEGQNWGDPSIDPCPYLGGQLYTVVEYALIICPADTCAGQKPGDANSDGVIDANDPVFLRAHFETGGPPPNPTANGDANGDCLVNYADIYYLEAYLQAGGPPPVNCTCVDPHITCCQVLTGNVDNDPSGIVDIGDLTALIAYLFIPPNTPPVCMEEANTDGDPGGVVDIGDLTALIAYLFIPPNPLPAPCQ